MVNYFGGFQPCSLVAFELPFLIVPLCLGLLLVWLSKRLPSGLSVNRTAVLIVIAVFLTLLVPLELYLFNGERFGLGSDEVTSIQGKLWTALLFAGPLVWLLCRFVIRNFQYEQLINIRKKCLVITGLLSIVIGVAFGLASSCYGVG